MKKLIATFKNQDPRWFAFALLLTLLVHALFLFCIQYFNAPESKKTELIKIQPISLKSSPQSLARKNKKVVDSTSTHNKKPDKAEYLAEHDNQTDQEQVSKNRSLNPSKPSGAQRDKQIASRPGVGEKISVPSWKELAAAQGSDFADDIDKAKKGSITSLNTWEWKHAAFFNRLKHQVAAHWSPLNQIRKYDPQGNQLGTRDKTTSVSVSLNRNGEIVDIQVADSSGVDYLDAEALNAFRKAAPFTNPPAPLFETNDTFTFQFGFHISMQRGLGFGFL